MFNPLSNDNLLDWSKLKAFADNKINVNQKSKSVLGMVTSIFSLSTMFSKGYLFRVVKSWDCIELILPNDKILDWFKLKEFANNKINVTEKIEICFEKRRKHGGKRRKCW